MPNRRQAIIWTNADPIHWRINAALGEDESRYYYKNDVDLLSVEPLVSSFNDILKNINVFSGNTFENISYKMSGICMVKMLTHWGRVTHICVSKLTIIGSDNGLSPGRCQAIIWNNAGLLLIEPLGTHFSKISIGIQRFSFKKMHLNMSSAKWRPFCLGLNVLKNLLFFYTLLFKWPTNRSLILFLIGFHNGQRPSKHQDYRTQYWQYWLKSIKIKWKPL